MRDYRKVDHEEENLIKIRCPHCGWEYLPGEIFLPDHFLGQPVNIDKDITGKILCYDGVVQNTNENFECVNCGKKLNLSATIKFNCELVKEEDFDLTHTSKKYSDRLVLKED